MFARRARMNRRGIGARAGVSLNIPATQIELGAISWDAWCRDLTDNFGVVATLVNVASPDSAATRYGYHWPVLQNGTRYLYTGSESSETAEQARVDSELIWMAEHGITYRAFVWYPREGITSGSVPLVSNIRQAMDHYFASPYKSYVKFSLIIASGMAAFDENGGQDGTWLNFDAFIQQWIGWFRDPQYLKTGDGRPVVFFFQSSGGTAVWNATQLNIIRDAVDTAGLPAMYEVQVNGNSTLANQCGNDAVTTYGPSGAILSNGHHAWTDQVVEDEGNWDGVGFSKDVVPGLTFSCDRRARSVELGNWADRATYLEAETHVQLAIDWIDEHPSRSPHRIALIYSHNELDEGGYGTIPTLQDYAVYRSNPELLGIRNAQSGQLPATWIDRYTPWSLHADVTRTATNWTLVRDLFTPDSAGNTAYEFSEYQSLTTDNFIQLAPALDCTGLEVRGSKSTARGIAEIFLDDVSQGTVDCYSTTVQRNTVIYSVTGLAAGAHSLRIVVTGTKNASSSAVTIQVDEFRAYMSR